MYQYLIASLPFIEFDARPLISYRHFLEDCQRLLSAKDFKIIQAATLLPSDLHASDNILLEGWNHFKNSLHNEFVIFRSAARAQEPNSHLRYSAAPEIYTGHIVAEAAKAKDPLAAEKIIDQAQWNYLEELGRGHYCDLGFLIVYALKLQICEKYQSIASPEGLAAFEQLRQETMSLR